MAIAIASRHLDLPKLGIKNHLQEDVAIFRNHHQIDRDIYLKHPSNTDTLQVSVETLGTSIVERLKYLKSKSQRSN